MASAWGQAWGTSWGNSWGVIATTQEVNWPGTTIPRSKAIAMQREALARVLRDEYEQEKRKAGKGKRKKISAKQAKRRVDQVVSSVIGTGILEPAVIDGLTGPINQLASANVPIADIEALIVRALNNLDFLPETKMEINRERAALAALEDEYAAIALLLAA